MNDLDKLAGKLKAKRIARHENMASELLSTECAKQAGLSIIKKHISTIHPHEQYALESDLKSNIEELRELIQQGKDSYDLVTLSISQDLGGLQNRINESIKGLKRKDDSISKLSTSIGEDLERLKILVNKNKSLSQDDKEFIEIRIEEFINEFSLRLETIKNSIPKLIEVVGGKNVWVDKSETDREIKYTINSAQALSSRGGSGGGGGAQRFTELLDTPVSYIGGAGKVVKVKGDGTGLEFDTIITTDEKVKASATDPTAGYLEDKVDNTSITVENEVLKVLSTGIGSTFPVIPFDGQEFILQLTGRTVKYGYDSTTATWISLLSFGTIDMYVDTANGTDSQLKGTGILTNAFKTIQYAVNQIPAQYTGNVVVNIAAGNYPEAVTIFGKEKVGGAYTIKIKASTYTTLDSGTLTARTAGSNTTEATITDSTKTFIVNAHFSKLVYFPATDTYRIAWKNTATVSTLYGNLSPLPAVGAIYQILDWAVTVGGSGLAFTIGDYQTDVVIEGIKQNAVGGFGNGWIVGTNASATFQMCNNVASGTAALTRGSLTEIVCTTWFTSLVSLGWYNPNYTVTESIQAIRQSDLQPNHWYVHNDRNDGLGIWFRASSSGNFSTGGATRVGTYGNTATGYGVGVQYDNASGAIGESSIIFTGVTTNVVANNYQGAGSALLTIWQIVRAQSILQGNANGTVAAVFRPAGSPTVSTVQVQNNAGTLVHHQLSTIANVGNIFNGQNLDQDTQINGDTLNNVVGVDSGDDTALFNGGQRTAVRVITAVGAVTVTIRDYIVILNKTVGAATTVNLPAGVTGQIFIIKDGKGDAAANNITITPAAGNIDGAATFVMNINNQSVMLVYNGTQWNII